MKDKLCISASRALNDYLKVTDQESVLLIYDDTTTDIADAFIKIVVTNKGKLTARKIGSTGRNGVDPDPETCKMMIEYPVIIALTQFSLTHCAATKAAMMAGNRVATLPGISLDLFARGLQINPLELNEVGSKWIEKLRDKDEVRIQSKAGTDLTFSIGQYKIENDDGCIFKGGKVGNLPAGEVFMSPNVNTANGTIVIDGSIAGFNWQEDQSPAVITVKDGYAVKFEGARGEALEKILNVDGKKGYFLAEFGIGTNSCLNISGNLLEDEKVKGTIHLAFGNNCAFGGDNEVPVHIDCLVVKPDIIANGECLMKNGDWQI